MGVLSYKLVTRKYLKNKTFTFVVVLLMFWTASRIRIFGSDDIKWMKGNLAYEARSFVGMIRKSVFDAAIDLPGFFQYF